MSRIIAKACLALSLACAKQQPVIEAPDVQTETPAVAGVPSPDDVLSQYVDAIGGNAAFRAHENYQASGYVEIAAQGIRGTVDLYMAAPDSRKMTMNLPGMGDVVRVYDGEFGWEINPMLGPRLLSEAELKVEQHDSRFYAVVDWEGLYPERELIGATDFRGTPCWSIQLRTEDGLERLTHFDQASGLLLGMEMTYATDMGEVPLVVRIEDYQDIGGVKIPMRSVQEMGPIEVVIQLESLVWDVETEMDLSMPDSVKDLIPAAPAEE